MNSQADVRVLYANLERLYGPDLTDGLTLQEALVMARDFYVAAQDEAFKDRQAWTGQRPACPVAKQA